MRRWPTWLVVGALVALGLVAAADALRGGGTTRRVEPTRMPGPLIPPNEPAGSAMSGTLFYSDAKDECRIHGLALPGPGNAPPPKLRSCRFSMSPNGQYALTGAVAWSPHGGLYAREVGDRIELGSPYSREALRFPGRAPAFKPDGTFTYVRHDQIVEWATRCPSRSRLFTLRGDNAIARCPKTLLTLDDLAGLLLTRPSRITRLAWLSETRLVALVGNLIPGLGYAESGAVVEGRRLVGTTPRLFGENLRIQTSPRGDYFALWSGDALFAIRDRKGSQIVFPPLRDVRALAWSPDERWTAVATEHSVYVFRTNEGEARVRRLPIEARDLAWR